MSDFNLNIETPFELPTKEILYERPEKMPYNTQRIKYKHYGRTIEMMIDKAIELEDGDHKEHLIKLIANNMKKSLLQWNKDFPGDERVFNDIRKLSNDKLVIPEGMKIPEFREHSKSSSHSNTNTNRNWKKKTTNTSNKPRRQSN